MGSSSMDVRTLTNGHPSMRVNTQLKQLGQWWCMGGSPIPPMIVCPAITVKRSTGKAALIEYGPPVMRWQPRQ